MQIEVHSGFSDDAWQQAEVERSKFMDWLAENHPEFEIDASSEWTGTMPYPALVVLHCLYFNDEWEMHVYWHNLIPPWDWTRLDLRRRFIETEPSIAFELSSGNPVPREIGPEGLWRSLF